MRHLLALIALSPGCFILTGFFGSDCGNNLTELADGETCDDGNSDPDDGCDNACQLRVIATCGDGIVEGTEACDDGNTLDSDTCESNCTLPACGNDILDSDEECDDGNLTNGDSCDDECFIEIPVNCGNSDLDPGEECDDGNNDNGDSCEANCTNPVCGNNIVDLTEECDQSGGNCLPDCSIGCGTDPSFDRRVVDLVSQHCYLAIDNNLNWPLAEADCSVRGGHLATISNFEENATVSSINVGQVWIDLSDQGTEGRFVWEDGEPLAFSRFRAHEPNDFPSEDCVELDAGQWSDQDCITQQDSYVCEFEIAKCGNGFLEAGEACDDDNTINSDGCSSTCQAEGATNCGNGTSNSGEECDDGNAFDGDGCDKNCQLEADIFLMCDGTLGAGDGSFENPFSELRDAIGAISANKTVMILGPNVCEESVDDSTNPNNKSFILKGSVDTNGGLLSSMDGQGSAVIELFNTIKLVVQDLKLLTNNQNSAVNVFSTANLALLHVDIVNENSTQGFAIESHGTNLLIDRALIHDNIGGGIVNNCDATDCSKGGQLIVTNSVFENNGTDQLGAPNDFGALSTFQGSKTLVVGATFINNISENGPSTSNCANQDSSARLESIISQDVDPNTAIGGCTTVNFSDFPGLSVPLQGTDNLIDNPDLISIAGFNFHLGPNSVAVNNANNNPEGLAAVAPFNADAVFGVLLGAGIFDSLFVTDFLGGPRRRGAAIDIGAVEER